VEVATTITTFQVVTTCLTITMFPTITTFLTITTIISPTLAVWVTATAIQETTTTTIGTASPTTVTPDLATAKFWRELSEVTTPAAATTTVFLSSFCRYLTVLFRTFFVFTIHQLNCIWVYT
jgi:hypothetical protein